MTKIETVESLIESITTNNIKTALIGNGFSLSHPTYGHKFKFKISDVLSKIHNLEEKELEKVLNCQGPYNNKCPETFLKGFRFYYIKCVLEQYIKIFSDKGNDFRGIYQEYINNSVSCSKFLEKIDTIFTTNYDPLIYFESLRYNADKKDNFFEDGFKGADFISQKDIMGRLGKSEKKIYYLHGSWFIQADYKDKNKLRKCAFGSQSVENIEDLFNFDKQELPYLIFEDRHDFKNALVRDSTYFKWCFKKLKEINEPIIVFGMSFNMDDHIVKKLKNKKIYITYLEDEDKEKLEKKFKSLKKTEVEYWQIGKNCIWNEQ